MASHAPYTAISTEKGARAYTPGSLKLYDTLVLGVVSPYGWRCPADKLVAFFNRNTAAPATRILDIGVGTGYFPAHAPHFSSSAADATELVLVDLNPHCLAATAPVVARAHPRLRLSTAVADFLAPDDNDSIDGTFDAISLMFLLHCLPGPPARKAAALVRTARRFLRPGGVVFGATILGKGVVPAPNALARLVLWMNNRLGIFDNYADDAAGFLEPLREAFADVRFEVVGCMLLFEAREPRGE